MGIPHPPLPLLLQVVPRQRRAGQQDHAHDQRDLRLRKVAPWTPVQARTGMQTPVRLSGGKDAEHRGNGRPHPCAPKSRPGSPSPVLPAPECKARHPADAQDAGVQCRLPAQEHALPVRIVVPGIRPIQPLVAVALKGGCGQHRPLSRWATAGIG